MSISELKSTLYSAIESIDDEQLLARYLQMLLKEVDSQSGTYTLTPEQEAAIEEAELELDAGKGIPHDVVKERLKKKYPNIVKWE